MVNTDLQRFNQTVQSPRFQEYLDSVMKEKKSAFVTALVSTVGNNKLMQKCDPMSLTYAMMKATALNLPFDGSLGYAYCIPYGSEAQFQIGARGLARLAINTGQFKILHVTEIYQGQYKSKDIRTGKIKLDDDVEIKSDTPVVGYLGYFQLNNGYEYELYWTKEQMTAHAKKYSKTFNTGPWKDSYDAMAKKTILKQLLKQGNAPMSIEMVDAYKADQAVIRRDERGNELYVYRDNPQTKADETEYVEIASEPSEEQKAKANELRNKIVESASKTFNEEKKETLF